MTVAFVGGRLIDGTAREPLEQAEVHVARDTITYAGAMRSAPTVDIEHRVDLDGRTILPGLINTHVHLSLNPYGPRRDWHQFSVDETTNTLEGYVLADECLDHGVTTLGDLSAPHHGFIKLGRAIASGLLQGPRIVSVGRALVVSGGHSYTLGREVDGPIEAARAAREEIRAGAAQVKLMVEAGTLEGAFERRQLEMTREEIRAAVEAAHGMGRMVRAHAITDEPVRAALDCGVDVIEHGYDISDDTIELMAERDVPLVPTIQVWKMALLNPDSVPSPVMLEHRRSAEGHVNRTLPRAIAAGVPIALGTDGSTLLNPAGEVLVELKSLVEYGMTPHAALRSATATAARVLGIAARVGTIEVGKGADLLVVDDDPLVDIEALANVHLVVRAGRIVRGPGKRTLHTLRGRA
jgi:imidazolonepropionase-like amidohydrolase